jgi:protein-L-isoaspartate(D-aspartate) O-methyltransferase
VIPTEAQRAMVRRQIFDRGLKKPSLLRAFLKVDREVFVGAGSRAQAHGDHPVTIGHGQTVSQPFMVALMLNALEVRPGVKVLEVGAGSGYVLALLSALGARPYGVEWLMDLACSIPERLAANDLRHVQVSCGDGGLGWPQESPFERILVSAACPEVPPPLVEQLAPGGILVAPVGTLYGQELVRLRKRPTGITHEGLGGCVFVPLRGKFGF